MFEVQPKLSGYGEIKVTHKVYDVRTIGETIEFLIYNGVSWTWVDSSKYKPLESYGPIKKKSGPKRKDKKKIENSKESEKVMYRHLVADNEKQE
ncbi:hypothetical protein ACK8P5_26015 (plasmid) [Paenibacillus sp. EC2-1]|uniref:hypothetical protein n=1 Tax=Paenibacillus sp. EC2-1 TaxID=3388665 RepID=UPI003BEF11BC